jgi:tetratricopeptide (TPR) repeat protein
MMDPLTPNRWRRVTEILDGALELEPAAQTAYVERCCDGDAGLRAAVETLLRADAASGDFLETPAAEYLALAPPEPVGGGLGPGMRIGPYRVVRELAHGGMGEVHLAERADGQFEQQVALKLVRAGADSAELRRRFLAERQILARLHHPHIARLLDGGVTPEGRPWLAMEYVVGTSLTGWCDTSALDRSARLLLFEDVCEAVRYAHQRLVIHRDLKPSNILVTDDGQVKLLDFGIAKLLEERAQNEGPGSAPATRTGLLALTPEYASPEQVRDEPVTTATDVYALGAVLYELLSGRRPYRFSRYSPVEIERVVCETDPDPPRLGVELDSIVLRALQKDPGRRYASADALLDDLRRLRAGLPVHARPDSAAYRARKFVRRHRLGVAAGAAVALALVAGLGAALWQARAAAREAAKAREVKDFVVDLFQVSDPAESRGREITARELLDRGVHRVDSVLGRQPALREELLGVLGRIHRELGLYPQADTLLTRAAELARQVYGSDDPEYAARLADQGTVRRAMGDLPVAESLLTRALRIRRRGSGAADDDVARTMGELANVLSDAGQHQRAESLYRATLAIDLRRYGPDHLKVAEDLSNLAVLYGGDGMGRLDAADSAYRAALAIRRRRLYPDHPLVLTTTGDLAAGLGDAGHYAEAESLMRQVLAGYRRVHPDGHPDVAWALHLLADLTREMGRYAESESLHVQALEMRRRTLGSDHPNTIATLNNLAILRYRMDDLAGAEQSFREALGIWRAKLGASHTYTIRAANNLGAVLSEEGKYQEAEALLRATLAEERGERGDSTLDDAMITRNLGIVLHRTGRLAEADHALRWSVASYRAAGQGQSPRLAEPLTALGAVLTDRRRPQEADSVLREALMIRTAAFPADDPRLAETRQTLGLALAGEGRRAEGRGLVAEACRIYERTPWAVRKARQCRASLSTVASP